MEYQIDNPDHIIDYWLPVFEAMSLKQFENFWELLGFPFTPTPELRTIAKDFSLLVSIYLRHDIPEQPSTEMPLSTDEIDPLIQIWVWTFSRLKALDYADKVYSWGQTTYQSPSKLLNSKLYFTDWDGFLIYWARDPLSADVLPLNFPNALTRKLQLIVIKYDLNHYLMRFQAEKAEEISEDTWDEYAFKKLGIGSWITNHVLSRNQIAKWNAIFALLSIDELETLDKWGYKNFQAWNNVKNYFSLFQLAAELYKPA